MTFNARYSVWKKKSNYTLEKGLQNDVQTIETDILACDPMKAFLMVFKIVSINAHAWDEMSIDLIQRWANNKMFHNAQNSSHNGSLNFFILLSNQIFRMPFSISIC